jgi:hypothetical protein
MRVKHTAAVGPTSPFTPGMGTGVKRISST